MLCAPPNPPTSAIATAATGGSFCGGGARSTPSGTLATTGPAATAGGISRRGRRTPCSMYATPATTISAATASFFWMGVALSSPPRPPRRREPY